MQIATVYFLKAPLRGRTLVGLLTVLATRLRSLSTISHVSIAIDGYRLESLLSGDVLVYERIIPPMVAAIKVPLPNPIDITAHVIEQPIDVWGTFWRAFLFRDTQAVDNCLTRVCRILQAGGARRVTKHVKTPASLYKRLKKEGYEICRLR